MISINEKQFLHGLTNKRLTLFFYKKPIAPKKLKINLSNNGAAECCLRTARIIVKVLSFFSVKTFKLISETCWRIARADISL